MKEAIITDLNGRYIEPTLVDDTVTGVFDIRTAGEGTPQEGEEAQPIVTGYTVAVQAPHGLYQPTFDVEGYRQAVQAYEVAYEQYQVELVKQEGESDSESTVLLPEPPPQVDGTSFWRNGLTEEEIQALQVQSKSEPSPQEYLGEQLVARELEGLELKQESEALGAALVASELRILEKLEENEHV